MKSRLLLDNARLNALEYQNGATVLESRPTWLQIEPTVLCNLHCRMCREQTHNVRPGRAVAPELFRKVSESGWLQHLQSIEINGWGETFLRPDIRAFFKQCADFEDLHVQITTNGLLLDDRALLEALCRLPRMRLIFSIDSPDPDAYEQIRRGGSFQRLTGNLRLLNGARRALGSPLVTECHCLVNALNLNRLCAMVDFAVAHEFAALTFIPLHNCLDLEVPDDLAVPAMEGAARYAEEKGLKCSTYARRIGKAEASASLETGRMWRCPRPWQHVSILSDGNVVPCCYLTTDQCGAIMGNLLCESLDLIWNSERYQTLRRSAFQGYPAFCRSETGGCGAKTSFKPNVRVP